MIVKRIQNSTVQAKKKNNKSSGKYLDLLPSKDDWSLILKGSRIIEYKKGDYVIEEGTHICQLFQIVKGSCSIVKKGIPRLLGKISHDDGIFGEISFIEGGEASASVIALEDTSIQTIEAYFLCVLFSHYPIAGRFYHYLASVLSKRVIERESKFNDISPSNEKITKTHIRSNSSINPKMIKLQKNQSIKY